MPVVAQSVCDGCGAMKRETNPWWTTRICPGLFVVGPYGLAQLNECTTTDGDPRYLCGVSSVTRCLSEFIGAEHGRGQGSVTACDVRLKGA